MNPFYYTKDAQYVLNHCTKYLARFNTDPRHNYDGDSPVMPRDAICEAWRFPIIDAYGGGAAAFQDPATFPAFNEVTFVYSGASVQDPGSVAVISTYNNLYQPIPLSRVMFVDEPTRYHTVTFVVPKNEVHLYKFLVDGKYTVDPINPNQVTLENGALWSRFFTEEYSQPLVLEDWELKLVYRMVEQILPFRTGDAETFLQQFYNYLDYSDKDNKFANIYRLDDSVGETNFVDNILAREERHRLVDYKICLRLIDRVLRKRNPYVEPELMSKQVYINLYNQMSTNQVPDWDYSAYGSPQFFLDLLRRHVVTGAFSHPKYGGNSAGAGWAYLQERYKDGQGNTLFAWQKALEPPLGANADYLG